MVLAFYLWVAPLYIQGGDTAELVAAAFHRLVPHPPGYPLYLWIQHLWTHTLNFSTVFWRASVLSSIISCLALMLVVLPVKRNALFFLIILLTLGLKEEFIEAAVLPDVFGLHALFIASFGYFFLFYRGEHRILLATFFFGMSLSNHHTSVLLLPCYLSLCLDSYREGRKDILWGSFFSILGCSFLYSSLLFLQTSHPLSWGNLHSLQDLLNHFLRSEYGTFRLTPAGEWNGTESFLFLLKSLYPTGALTTVLFLMAYRQDRSLVRNGPFKYWLFSLALTLGLSFFMNVPPRLMGAEILKRFHVMPLVMLAFLNTFFLSRILLIRKSNLILAGVSLPAIILNFLSASAFLDLRHDSVVEDYSRNLLREAKEHSPSVVVAHTDSSYFAMRYLQSFEMEEYKKNVAVVSLPLFFHPWYAEKIKSIQPFFSLPNAPEISRKKYLHEFNDFLGPNIKSLRIIYSEGIKEGLDFKLTFLPLGRMIEHGKGTYFDNHAPIIRYTPSIDYNGPQAFTKKKLFYEYSHYHLAKSYESLKRKEDEKAIESWQHALMVVPFSYVAMFNLCQVNTKFNFCKQLDTLKIKVVGFY